MLDKWLGMSDFGEVEIEVSQWYQNLIEDTVTRTTFGTNYIDGKRIFQLQARQMVLTSEAFKEIPIPGYRYVRTQNITIHNFKIQCHIFYRYLMLVATTKSSLRTI